MFQRVVILGSCQADALTLLIAERARQSFGAEIRFLSSNAPFSKQSRALLEQADAIVEEVFNKPQLGNLADVDHRAAIIRFPIIAGTFLWPYAGIAHPTQIEPGIHHVFGGVENGDGRLTKIIKSGENQAGQLRRYCFDDLATSAALSRRYEIFLEMQHDRDVAAGFSVATLIESHFRRERLFTTPGHPTMRLMQPLLEHVLTGLGFPLSFVAAVADGATETTLSWQEMPIHPSVAAHFGLSYGHAGETYLAGTGERMTFAEHAGHYVFLSYNRALAEAIIDLKNPQALPEHEVRGAIERLEQAAAVSTGSVFANDILARLYSRIGDTGTAMRYARNSCALTPASAGAWLRYGRMAIRHAAPLEAEEALLTALRLRPRSGLLWSELSHLLLKQGDTDRARDLARQAQVFDGWDPTIRARAAHPASAVSA